jgi:hypothetical protein
MKYLREYNYKNKNIEIYDIFTKDIKDNINIYTDCDKYCDHNMFYINNKYIEYIEYNDYNINRILERLWI